jgi:hypothetical protein
MYDGISETKWQKLRSNHIRRTLFMNSDISAQRQGFTADQYVHIDHAPLEVLLGTPGDGDNLARPCYHWL